MMWVDYSIDSIPGGRGFKVVGDTPTEVMDKGLYKPGDVFIVNESGWLIKTDEVNALLLKHESTSKQLQTRHSSPQASLVSSYTHSVQSTYHNSLPGVRQSFGE